MPASGTERRMGCPSAPAAGCGNPACRGAKVPSSACPPRPPDQAAPRRGFSCGSVAPEPRRCRPPVGDLARRSPSVQWFGAEKSGQTLPSSRNGALYPADFMEMNGDPEWIRTTNLPLRRGLLYPVEPRGHTRLFCEENRRNASARTARTGGNCGHEKGERFGPPLPPSIPCCDRSLHAAAVRLRVFRSLARYRYR